MTDPTQTQETPLYLHRIVNGEWIRPLSKTVTEIRTELTGNPATAYAVEAFDALWSRAVRLARSHGWRFDFIHAPVVFTLADDEEDPDEITHAFLFQEANDRPYVVAQRQLRWAEQIATEPPDAWTDGWNEGYAAGFQQGHIDRQAEAVAT